MNNDLHRRPCHAHGTQPNACALAHYRRTIDNHLQLHGEWSRWRLAGRDLVSPFGHRINPQRLLGILLKADGEDRLERLRRCRRSPEQHVQRHQDRQHRDRADVGTGSGAIAVDERQCRPGQLEHDRQHERADRRGQRAGCRIMVG